MDQFKHPPQGYGIAAGDYAKQEGVQSWKAQQQYPTDGAVQVESQLLLSRLRSLRSYLNESRGLAGTAADKIVGYEPLNKLNGSESLAQAPEPSSFLPQLTNIILDLENVVAEIVAQLNRLHRSF